MQAIVQLTPRGPFSLAAAAAFAQGFPGTIAAHEAGALRIAWAVDGDWRTAVATLRQDGDGTVHAALEGDAPAELAARDAERILSLDVDGVPFAAVAARDPVIAALWDRLDHLRPVLFFTPYEAAAWAIIGQRISRTQASAVMRRLAGETGAFPAPERLAALGGPQRGLTDRKVQWLRALGEAALDGALDRGRLRALAPAEAAAELQRLPGIGPFGAELVLVRGVGAPDALPEHEGRLVDAIRAAYGLAEDADLTPVTDAWRPRRTWAALLLRVSAD